MISDTSTHIVPVNDLKDHTSVGLYCHCEPVVEKTASGNYIVTHNAYDGREFDEEPERGH